MGRLTYKPSFVLGALSGSLNASVRATTRTFPADATEWAAEFPGITVPTSIWTMQDLSSPAVDSVGSNDLVGGLTPVFNTPSENGRVGVLMDDTGDVIEVASAAALDPDGVTDMTYWVRIFVPAVIENNNSIIFAKRSDQAGFPGFEVYFLTDGRVQAVTDAGASLLITTHASDHRGSWQDIALVLDRAGSNEVRIETSLGVRVGDLTTIGTMANTQGFLMGFNADLSKVSTLNAIYAYGAAWDGAALTRAEFLEIWS